MDRETMRVFHKQGKLEDALEQWAKETIRLRTAVTKFLEAPAWVRAGWVLFGARFLGWYWKRHAAPPPPPGPAE